jgi:hypothetical protein
MQTGLHGAVQSLLPREGEAPLANRRLKNAAENFPLARPGVITCLKEYSTRYALPPAWH